MKIIRYSLTGFKPQYQSHHLNDIDYYLNRFDISVYPKWMRDGILQKREQVLKFYNQNRTDLEWGIWAFIDGYKNNVCLNHLKQRVPCWEAEISDDTIVYPSFFEKKTIITDTECKLFGFYIPANQLGTLRNVCKRRKVA